MLSRFVFVLEIRIKRAFTLLFHMRFLFSFRLSPEEGAPPTLRLRGRAPSTQFPWHFSCRGLFASCAGCRCVPPWPART